MSKYNGVENACDFVKAQSLSICELDLDVLFHHQRLNFWFFFAFIHEVRQDVTFWIKSIDNLRNESLEIILFSKMLHFKIGELQSSYLYVQEYLALVITVFHSLYPELAQNLSLNKL